MNSIYVRALGQNPTLEGHNLNVAQSGSDVSDLPRQVERALANDPLPDLFIIQAIDNDIRCDGTDAVIEAADLTVDSYHLSIQGQTKMAETAWAALHG